MTRWKEAAAWWIALSVLAVLIAGIAVLQYRSLGQLGEAERTRLRAGMQSATNGFARELDNELSRLFAAFGRMDVGPSGIEESMRRWKATAAYPQLLKSASIATSTECLSGPCPEWLQGRTGDLQVGELAKSSGPAHTELVFDDVPALAIARFGDLSKSPPVVSDWVVLELDRGVLARTVLPELARRWFGSDDGSGFQVAVVRDAQPNDVIYESKPNSLKSFLEGADSSASLLRLPDVSNDASPGPERFFRREVPSHAASATKRAAGEWRLLVRHEAGSLDAAVAGARLRNLVMNGSSLLLLSVTIAVLLVITRRAQSLAGAQLEFVAGVSHELKTPLSVIRSAGYNLSRGVITDWAKAREYGDAVRTEARGLTEIIDRAMYYAAFQSGSGPMVREPVQLPRIIEAAIAECAPTMDQARLEVRFRAEEDVPAVRADAAAIQHCIQNLLSNAAKYAAHSAPVSIGVARCDRDVQLWVEDHGPGIHPDDLPKIFRSFYRGRPVQGHAVQGVGLGLTLVDRTMRAHQGRVSVASRLGEGTRFVLHFPAA